MKDAAILVGSIISGFLFVLHCVSIYFTLTKLRKSRFFTLVLYLSISDSFVALEYIYLAILRTFNWEGDGYLYQCMFVKQLLGGTVVSSLFQTAIIGIDRLNASFVPRKEILISLTSDRVVFISSFLLHLLSIIRFTTELRYEPYPCDVMYTLTPLIIYTLDVSAITLVLIIVIMYWTTTYRVIFQMKTYNEQLQTTESSFSGLENRKKLRRNMITFGCIITLTLVSILPRSLVAFYIYIYGVTEKTRAFIMIANSTLLILNPLLDPIIYILRIRKFRNIIKAAICICRPAAVAPEGQTSD